MNRYEVYLNEVRTFLVGYEVLATNKDAALKKAIRCHKGTDKPIEDKLLNVEVEKVLNCYLTETKVKMPSKKKKKFVDGEDGSYGYSHVGCPSYPNCDIDPNGCILDMGDDVEFYGMRD